jgi:hypothetical protein
MNTRLLSFMFITFLIAIAAIALIVAFSNGSSQ